MKKLFICIMVSCLFVHKANAQAQQYTFNNLNEKDGLRNNIVFSFLKDSHGIMWIGTQNGLNRFDGSHFYSFKKKNGANSLPNNTIHCLTEDKEGDIWGGTDNGVFCYSPSQNNFTTYYAPNDCYNNTISNILCDKAGDIYAATSLALMKFNKTTKAFQLLTKFTNRADSTGWYIIGKNRLLKDDKNNGFWIATARGLLFYDNNANKLSGAFNNPAPLFATRSTTALAKSPDRYFWFFDNIAKELIAFDPTLKTILKKISIKKEAPDAKGATILQDSQNRLWFSSWSYDLLTIDLAANNKISKIQSKEGNKNTVAADFFWAGLQDENGSIWLGTPNGISICSPGKTVYNACQLPAKIPALKTTVINIIEEDANDKTWWLVTGDLKVIHYYPETEKYIIYGLDKFVPNKDGLRPKDIIQLRFIDKSIVITSVAGAWQLKQSSNTFVPWIILPAEYADFKFDNFIEADSVLYATDGLRMLSWNRKTNKANWITNANADLNANVKFGFTHLLWKPNQNFYWTLSGDYIASVGNDYSASLVKIVKDSSLEAGGYFHSADMDNEGNVWVINKGVGLYRYNPHTKAIKYWTEADGLGDNHMHSIKADNNGNIWTLYFNKASVFNAAKNSFINFSIPYSENNLNYFNWSTKRTDGIIMGSIANDVFEFDAKKLNQVPAKKTPELSVLSVSGNDYFITTTDELKLNSDENSLRFKFGLLVDGALYPHEFEYMLEGSDKKWVHSSTSNEAGYNNLPPGSYTFHIIAKGKNNAWQSGEKLIKIKIKTPFYKSTLFIILITLLIATLLFWLYKNRLKQQQQMFLLKGKAQLLEKEKTMVMYESLKQQLNPHFLFNSLTSLSGLIETDQQVAGNFLEQMSGIYRYILRNGDTETVTIKDEINFVKLYISLQQTRFKKGLQVNINVPEDYLHYKIAPVTLQNLIENAIKHNIIDMDSPLVIDIFIENDYVVVKNNLQKKDMVETSNKKGLSQFETLYKYLSDKPIIIEESNKTFTIKIPLI